MKTCALLYLHHSFAYEVQAVAKIFLPGVRFLQYETDSQTECENQILTEVGSRLNVFAVLNGRMLTRTAPLPESRDKDAVEFALCTLLYETLQELTGYTPPWGLITGIRPVRKVIQLLDAGLSPAEAAARLQSRYRISDEKIRLAVETALVQQPVLPHSPKEIGFYVAVPFCPTRCRYCSFVSHSIQVAHRLIPDYLEKLCEEIAVFGQLIREYGLTVQSVYIGGGTPTSLSAEQLRQVMEAVRTHIGTGTREYTVEAGRADTITAEKLRVIQELGATRISVNPQTLQDSVLQAIGRRHTAQQAIDAFRLARSMGFSDINMDLIAGLPTDSFDGFADTLKRVIALETDSITVHTLTLKRAADLYADQNRSRVHNTVWQCLSNDADLCADQSRSREELAEVIRMTALSAASLPENGYRPYYLYRQKNTIGNLENVGYARPGKENLYNILIMDETQTIFAAGCAAASSKIVSPDGDIHRIVNYKFPYEYISRFDRILAKKQEIRALLG